METLSSLNEFINKPANIKSLKHLTSHPNYSQLVVVKSEDGIWYRARVMDASETDKEYEVCLLIIVLSSVLMCSFLE